MLSEKERLTEYLSVVEKTKEIESYKAGELKSNVVPKCSNASVC